MFNVYTAMAGSVMQNPILTVSPISETASEVLPNFTETRSQSMVFEFKLLSVLSEAPFSRD